MKDDRKHCIKRYKTHLELPFPFPSVLFVSVSDYKQCNNLNSGCIFDVAAVDALSFLKPVK